MMKICIRSWQLVIIAPLLASQVVAQTFTIDWNTTYQTIDGFGASDAWFADDWEGHSKRNEIADLLFTDQGANLSIFRQRISPRIRPSSSTWDFTNKDWKGSGWTAKQARNRGVGKIWASCWSSPKWMKDNSEGDGFNGGTIRKEHYDDYAEFLTRWVIEMKKQHNVTYYGISPQNEPGDKPWEANEWSVSAFENFMINHMKPEFTQQNISAKLLFPEETRWNDINRYSFRKASLKNSFDIISGHNYNNSSVSDYTSIGRPIWHTEHFIRSNTAISGALLMAQEIHDFLTIGQVNAYHWWWAVGAFGNDKPARERGLIYLNDNTNYTIHKQLWAMGQFSRFIRPGYQRIATTDPTSGVYVSAYKNASGKLVVVAINKTSKTKEVTLDFEGFTSGTLTPYRTSGSENIKQLPNRRGGASAASTLAPQSITTFVSTANVGNKFPIAGTYYNLRHVNSGRYLDTNADKLVNTRLSKNGNDRQWSFYANGSVYGIINRGTNRGALDTSNDGKVQWVTTSTPSSADKLWEMVEAGNNRYYFRNQEDNKDWLAADGSGRVFWTNANTPPSSALWQVELVGGSNARSDFSASGRTSTLAANRSDWQAEADMLQRRGEHANAIVNGKFYVMGGIANSNTGPRAVEVYDFTTNQWATVSQLPVHKNHFTIGASVYGNEIWVCGGKPNGPGSGGSKAVNIYNTTTNSWRRGPDLPEDHWAGPAVIVGKKLHVLSGGKGKFAATDHHFVLDLTNEAAGWRTLKKVPKPRVHGAGVAFGGKIWLIGGELSHAHDGDTKTVQVYDPRTNTWELNVPQLPEARSHHEWATFVHENKIYSVSGVNSAKKPRGQATIYVYSKAAGRWNQAFDLPGKLVSPGAKIHQGRMYVFGGGVNDWFEGDMVSVYSREIGNKETSSPKPPSINQTAVIVSKANPAFTLQVNSSSNRTRAVVEARDDKGQVWTISDRGNGFHKIVNNFANKALEAWQRNPGNGDDITIYSANNKDWQQWEFVEAGNGYFRIKGKYNPRFVTLSDGNAVMLSENGQDEQLWQLEAVDGYNTQAARDPKEAFISDEAGASQDVEVKLFPNPASQTVAVQLPVLEGEVLVTLVDFTGREVLRQWRIGSLRVRFSVQSLPRGLYQVRVQQANKVISRKLLIE